MLTHSPLNPQSTYDLAECLKEAYFISQSRAEPDLELDLCGHDPAKPKIGNHWARRKADKTAQDAAEELNIPPGVIDEGFGWDQHARNKKQQIRYAGTTELKQLAKLNLRL